MIGVRMAYSPSRIAALVANSGPTRFGPGCQLPRCKAKAKSSGERCKLPAMKGKEVCRVHGGHSKGAGKRRSVEGRGDYFVERQLPRRQIYADYRAKRATEDEPTIDALKWVSRNYPDLHQITGARFFAAKAFDRYESGAITWREFQKELETAALLA